MKKKAGLAVISLMTVLFLPLNSLFALDELYDAPGFNPNRETFSSMPNEHIDTFTGGLILTFEDVRLPGKGGLDLVIQRTFNSKNVCNGWDYLGFWRCSRDEENTWLGYGWTLHLGRLFESNNINVPHVIEMPDGSRHTAYPKISSSLSITKDYWLLNSDSNPPVLTLTNGTKIYYGQSGPGHPDYPSHSASYATRIQDVHGNEINIYYENFGSNVIAYVIDTVGRRVEFTTGTVNDATRLTTISVVGTEISIGYSHQSLPAQGKTLLTQITQINLPEVNLWRYAYNPYLYDLTQITTPYGGTINYTYDFVQVDMGFTLTYRTIIQKSTGGTVPSGTWTLAYSQGTDKDYTQINDPCGRTIKHYYYGYGEDLPDGSMWKLGLPKRKEVVGEETTTYAWTNSSAISNFDYVVPYVGNDSAIFVPLLNTKSITRDGRTYTATYSNYDNYGNPETISETGDQSRQRSISYWYNTSTNIVQNKPSSETISGGFPGSFTTSFTYDANGNPTQVNRYGTITNNTYWSDGNLRRTTDANGHWVEYSWNKGRISNINKNSIYSISRVISDDGTVASETNGWGKTTYFTYDGLLRILSIDPPEGNTTNFYYPSDNSYKKETRGQYEIYHYIDGFGRPVGTSDSKGIETDIVYKTCGPKDNSTSNIGDTVYYDNFNRPTEIRHKDNNTITYAYSNSDVNPDQ